MKKTIVMVVLGIAVLAIWAVRSSGLVYLDTGFASRAELKFGYSGEKQSAVITDGKDLDSLKRLLRGFAYTDFVTCGYGSDVSVTLCGKNKRLVLHPALSGDPIFTVGGSWTTFHMSDAKRKEFDEIGRRHGVDFLAAR